MALKAIRRDYTADPVYRARFHEEVSNARKVASFCTARVLDHGEHDGVLFLVTEYIEGVSLEDHLHPAGAACRRPCCTRRPWAWRRRSPRSTRSGSCTAISSPPT